MFSITSTLLKSIRKRSFELFFKEQSETSHLWKDVPAAEKKKKILKAFESLSKTDYENLKARAEALQKKGFPQAKPNKDQPKTLRNLPKISLYEFFVKEQSSSPSITVLPNPRDRELVLLDIFNNLPNKAKEALKKRAEEYERFRAARIAYYDGKSSSSGTCSDNYRRTQDAPQKTTEKHPNSSDVSGKKAPKSKRKKIVGKASERARVVSPFANFVKQEMPRVQDLPMKERMKEIAKRWKGLPLSERATHCAEGNSIQGQLITAGESAIEVGDAKVAQINPQSSSQAQASAPETQNLISSTKLDLSTQELSLGLEKEQRTGLHSATKGVGCSSDRSSASDEIEQARVSPTHAEEKPHLEASMVAEDVAESKPVPLEGMKSAEESSLKNNPVEKNDLECLVLPREKETDHRSLPDPRGPAECVSGSRAEQDITRKKTPRRKLIKKKKPASSSHRSGSASENQPNLIRDGKEQRLQSTRTLHDEKTL